MNSLKSVIVKYKFDLIAVIIILLLSAFISNNLAVLNIQGNSMAPTYSDGDILFLNKNKVINNKDIAIFSPPESWGGEDSKFIKRVVGKEGDKVSISRSDITINGEKVNHNKNVCELTNSRTFTIEKDMYLVMGDNISNSNDSITQYCLGNNQFLINKSDMVTTGKESFVIGGVFK